MNGGPIDCIADTGVIIGLLRDDPWIKQQISDRSFAITFITLAELSRCYSLQRVAYGSVGEQPPAQRGLRREDRRQTSDVGHRISASQHFSFLARNFVFFVTFC